MLAVVEIYLYLFHKNAVEIEGASYARGIGSRDGRR